MKKLSFIFGLMLGFSLAMPSFAQLPANPWQPKPPAPNDGYFGPNVPEDGPSTPPDSPEYAAGITQGEILPVDPWARARDRTGTRTWRQSGNHGRLNYVGEATTWGTAQGQEMIAPEVNRHNMLVMTEHLRAMGYKIPTSYDAGIRNAPQNYKRILRDSYSDVYVNNDPISKITTGLMEGFEDGTGLDIENLLFNSIDILSTD